MRLDQYRAALERRRISKLREARKMLRQGITVSAISGALGLSTNDIAAQRRLLTLVGDGTDHIVHANKVRAARRARTRDLRAVAEDTGDLCDILAAPPSRRDLRFAYRGDG